MKLFRYMAAIAATGFAMLGFIFPDHARLR